jgi:hypothetical protein
VVESALTDDGDSDNDDADGEAATRARVAHEEEQNTAAMETGKRAGPVRRRGAAAKSPERAIRRPAQVPKSAKL